MDTPETAGLGGADPVLVTPNSPGDPARSRGMVARMATYLRQHPILALLLLSPGIPEYLSSSSSMTGLVVAPPVFLLFLGLNLGLYGPGVLLIREAAIRWRKGWATIILLGAAYAILEEGLALSTFFNSHAGPVGALGFYGHFAGVSWVWVTGLIMVHVVFSISLPLLVLGLALPETRGRPLLDRRQIRMVAAVWAADLVLLSLLVVFGEHFWMGWPLWLGSVAAIAALVLAARSVPARWLEPAVGPPRQRPWVFAVLGLALFPGTLLIEGIGEAARAPPVLIILLMLAFFASEFGAARRWIGTRSNRSHLVAFAGGVVAFVGFFGFVASLPAPVVGVVDLAFAFLFLRIWRRYAAEVPPVQVPRHVLPV